MEILAYLSLLIVLSYLLVQAADLVEDAFVLVARKLGVRPFIIGFVVLSLASSMPEFSLIISSTATGVPNLSLGNLIGGTIVLLTLLVGVNAVKHKKIPFRGKFGVNQVITALLVLAVQILALIDQKLTIVEGFLMITTYAIFVFYVSQRGSKNQNFHEHAKVEVGKLSKLLLRSVGGIFGLIILSRLLVEAAIQTADILAIPASVVGLIVLAIGTNIPELAITLRSKNKKQEQLAIGNALGSASINTALIGFLAVLAPHQIENFSAIIPSLIILGVTLLLFGSVSWTDHKITRREGFMLLGVYGSLIFVEGLAIFIS